MNAIVLKGLLCAAVLAVPLMASAESNFQTGAATASPGATAHLDFQITIPKILYLRVGTGSSYTTGIYTSNAAVDQVAFAPTAAAAGNGVAVAGTGGDLSGGVETAATASARIATDTSRFRPWPQAITRSRWWRTISPYGGRSPTMGAWKSRCALAITPT